MKVPGSHLDISITTETLLRALAIVLGVAVLYLIRDVIAVLLFSVIIAAAITPLANYLQKKGVPRTLGVFLIYFLAFLALGTVLYFIISPLATELDNLSLTVPLYFDKVNNFFKLIRDTAPQYEQLLGRVQDSLLETSNELAHVSGNIFGATTGIFGGVVSAVFVIVISFYLSAQEHGINIFLRSVTPKERQGYVLGLWARAQYKLGRWLQAQIILSVIVGILVYIGLAVFGINHRVLLAMVAAIMEIIPIFGPVLAAIPAVLFGLLKSPVVGLWVVLIYTIVHQLENHVFVPNIMNRAIGLNPVIVIISLLIGAELFGLPGIILGVPVAVVLVEILKDFGHHHEEKV
ncbi:MAG: AI-2E family transporter [Candidatus Sungbacteria bacterium]|uniref:AI-2E family transporter n=1 Tax=Candidatus Sungiibacteriota bacterium TaxID=2750080 RepID=A0A932DS23_9BACT|nr:AI-2E family transporter [Candidatus Sungbacteria bacterium]